MKAHQDTDGNSESGARIVEDKTIKSNLPGEGCIWHNCKIPPSFSFTLVFVFSLRKQLEYCFSNSSSPELIGYFGANDHF